MKPTVDIRDCYIYADSQGRERLAGVVLNYPDDHMHYAGCVVNGGLITTSLIVSKSVNTIETLRTIYNVQNWANNESTT
jgi:hypothetical protein